MTAPQCPEVSEFQAEPFNYFGSFYHSDGIPSSSTLRLRPFNPFSVSFVEDKVLLPPPPDNDLIPNLSVHSVSCFRIPKGRPSPKGLFLQPDGFHYHWCPPDHRLVDTMTGTGILQASGPGSSIYNDGASHSPFRVHMPNFPQHIREIRRCDLQCTLPRDVNYR